MQIRTCYLVINNSSSPSPYCLVSCSIQISCGFVVILTAGKKKKQTQTPQPPVPMPVFVSNFNKNNWLSGDWRAWDISLSLPGKRNFDNTSSHGLGLKHHLKSSNLSCLSLDLCFQPQLSDSIQILLNKHATKTRYLHLKWILIKVSSCQ